MKRRLMLAVAAFAVCAQPSCFADDDEFSATQVEPVSEASVALTGATNPINCGYQNGRECRGAGTLAHSITDQAPWDPCLGGVFTWTATASFEQNYDRMCVGGVATPGSGGGCTAGTAISGSGTWTGSSVGKTTLSLATDGSVASAGLTSLTATCQEPLFSGVYRTGSNAAQQVFVTAKTWTEFTTDWATYSAQGKRLSKINIYYDVNDTARFDGLFVAGSGAYGLNAGLTFAQLEAQRITNRNNGMEISDVEAQQTSGGVVFTGVWRAGTRNQALYNGTVANYWAWASTYVNAGWQPTDIESWYDANDVHNYTVVMTQTPGQSGVASWVGLTYDVFVRQWAASTAAGWRLNDVETHVQGGVRYYDGFLLGGLAQQAQDYVSGARYEQFLATFEANKAAGLELVDFDRFKRERTTANPMNEERLLYGDYPNVAPTWMAEVDKFFTSTTSQMGYTVALMKDGELLGASSAGRARGPNDGNVSMSPDAQWDWLSIVKMVTSFVALKVAQDQSIDVTTTKLLPYVSANLASHGANLGTPGTNNLWNMTILQAMTHNSNLKNGGCDSGVGSWESNIDYTTVINGPLGGWSYSGYNACMLRLFVEARTGLTFPQALDKYLFRPLGIHNVDCTRDPEPVAVKGYCCAESGGTWDQECINLVPLLQDPAEPPTYCNASCSSSNSSCPGTLEPDTYCAAAGIKATGFDLLKLMQGIRNTSSVFNSTSLALIRANGMTFGINDWASVHGFASSGGREAGMHTFVTQFPATQAGYTQPAHYTSGIDAILFHNSMSLVDQDAKKGLFAGMAADPTP